MKEWDDQASQKGSGSIPDLTSQTDLHRTFCKHACEVDCDVKSGIDPIPLWLGCEQKILGFSQALRPIKWQDLLEEGKNGCNAFWTDANIRLSAKNILGLGTL